MEALDYGVLIGKRNQEACAPGGHGTMGFANAPLPHVA